LWNVSNIDIKPLIVKKEFIKLWTNQKYSTISISFIDFCLLLDLPADWNYYEIICKDNLIFEISYTVGNSTFVHCILYNTVINYPPYNLPHNFEHDTSIIPSLIYNVHESNLKNEESMILSKKSPKNIYILL
jgi:hypothetical protein